MISRQPHAPYQRSHTPVNQASRRHARNIGYRTIAGNDPGSERRRGNARIPDDPTFILSEEQSRALPGIQYTGWDICFLRERLFLDPEIVMHNRDDGRYGILDIDGWIRMPDELKVRKQRAQVPSSSRRQAQDLTYITV